MFDGLMEWLHQLHDPEGLKRLISSGGIVLLMAIVFSETGLLIGFFLPGDSLLFLAGALCSVNLLDANTPPPLDFLPTAVALVIAAILGNTVNYWLGRWAGETVWDRPDGRFIKRRYLEEAHAFYEKWGALSLVLTRYVPIARTFVPFIAGVSRMNFGAFTLWNVVGAVAWVPVLMAVGYWLGRIPFIQRNLEAIVLGVIVISILPMVVAAGLRWLRTRRGTVGGDAAASSDAGKRDGA
jgi:membrane-associated protein